MMMAQDKGMSEVDLEIGDSDLQHEVDQAEITLQPPRKCRLAVAEWRLATVTVTRGSLLTAVAVKGKFVKVLMPRTNEEGWVPFESSDGKPLLVDCKSYRRHEEWTGRQSFMLGGFCMVGSNPWGILNTMLLMSMTVAIFLCLFQQDDRFSGAWESFLKTITVVLWGMSSGSLWLTASTDPGIIPPNPGNGPPVSIERRGTSCKRCKMLKPPRAGHCRECNVCVDRRDHHCPWAGGCIGVRNYAYFFMLLNSATLLFAVMAVVSLARLVVIAGKGAGILAMVTNIVMLGASLFVEVSLLSIWWFHIATVVRKNQTTIESVKGLYNEAPNPYDQGCAKNCWTVLCGPKPRSLLPNFAEILTPHGMTGTAPVREEDRRLSSRESASLLAGRTVPRYGEAEDPLAAVGGHILPL